MPGVVYYAAASLDGYIAESDDSIDWLTGYEGAEPAPGVTTVPGGYDEFYEDVGAMVSGSVTYEWVLENASSWPYSGKPFWVMSSRELRTLEGEDIRFGGTFEEMIASAGERKLWIVGGGGIASQFAEAGLLDEIWVTVVPVALASGKQLFDGRLQGTLRLAGVLPRANGMVELRYDRLPA
jgi:dihydrofolate reductase